MAAPEGQLEAVRRLVARGEANFAQPFAHGSMRCVYFVPRGEDTQSPHTQDELYVIIAGTGTLKRGEEEIAFTTGDTLFVPAGQDHRFIDFSTDFECWAVFWGPAGGETADMGAPSR